MNAAPVWRQGIEHYMTEQESPRRRYDDVAVARWKRWAILTVTHGLCIVGGMLLRAHSPSEVNVLVTGLVGGTIAFATFGVPLVKNAISNLESVAKTRGERIEELEGQVQEMRDAHAKTLAANAESEKVRDEKHAKEVKELQGKVKKLEDALDQLQTQNASLLRALQNNPHHAGMRKILYVDDNEDHRRLYKYLLAGAGYDVQIASDAVRGLEMYEEQNKAGAPYDLIILDWQMPNLTGEEAAHIIRQTGGVNARIVMFTAHESEVTEGFSIQHHVPVWKKTGLTNDEFLNRVRQVLA